MISSAIRPIAVAAIASIALVGGAEAAAKHKSHGFNGHHGQYQGYVPQPYYGYPQVAPAGSYDPYNGIYQNFTNLPRDTRNEGFNNRYGLDWGWSRGHR